MQTINVGTNPNDHTGDTLRDAFIKVKNNFDELVAIDSSFSGDIQTLNTIISNGSTLNHTHTISQIIGLQTVLSGKVSTSTFNTQILAINSSIQAINSTLSEIIDILNTKIGDAPFSGITYGRRDGQWVEITGSGVDTFTTGGTYSNGTAIFTNNTGGTFSVSGFTTPFTGGTVTGQTNFTNGLTANTISATTYYNLPPINLDNLSDVTILSGITSGDTLMYNGSVWENINPFHYFDAKPIVYQKHTNTPTFGSASINNVEGVVVIASGVVARNWADTDIVSRTQRLGINISTTGNASSQLRQSIVYFSRNSGFDLLTGFNMAENATDTAIRFFIGLSTVTLFTNVEPNTLLNCVGICRLSTSNNLHIVYNDNTGIGTTIDLGSNFPANTISTDKYLLKIKAVSTGIYIKLERVGTAFSYETTLTSDIPSTSTGLNFGAYIVDTSGPNATTGFDWYGSYIMTNN